MAPHQSKKCSRSSEWHSDTSSSCICCSGVSSKHSTPLACGSRTRANIHASVFSTFNTSSLFLQTHFTYVWALFACIWPFGLFSVRLPVQLNVCLAFFFPICFCFFCCFFSSFPFTAFPTELLPGWLILILTLLINWLFFKVISICPSAGETASSQHSLANTSSSLCRLPLVQVMVLFGPDDKAWAFFRQIYNNGNNGVIPRWAGCWVIYTQFCIVCPYIFCDHLSETDAYGSCPKAQLGRKKVFKYYVMGQNAYRQKTKVCSSLQCKAPHSLSARLESHTFVLKRLLVYNAQYWHVFWSLHCG